MQQHGIHLRIFRQCARNYAHVTRRPDQNQSQTAVNERKPAHFPGLRLSPRALAGLWRNSFRATAGAVSSFCRSCSCTGHKGWSSPAPSNHADLSGPRQGHSVPGCTFTTTVTLLLMCCQRFWRTESGPLVCWTGCGWSVRG